MDIPEIDRELVYLRREEANACMRHRLFHAAILTAGSGLELLLMCLVGDLYRALDDNPDQAELAEQLMFDLKNFGPQETLKRDWGLGTWIGFYDGYQVPDRLCKSLHYRPKSFDFSRLRKANNEYTKAKHEPYKVTVEDASQVIVYFDELLDEVGVLSAEERGKLAWRKTWRDRINHWVVQNRASPETVLLRELFPLLEVVERLIHHRAVGYEHKAQLMLAENYVFSTIDLVKDDERRPQSLVDDAAVLILTLHWLLSHPGFQNEILHACWQPESNVEYELDRLYQFTYGNHEKLFPDARGQVGRQLVWTPLSRISEIGPEALWQNYWKEAY
ncbi:MAG: hypothetical protein OXI77_07025 [Chloroflexota bacterium]|nr:hypothetical protein [Chloroflexota bacterium]MDE2910267.1 hypothetical protein [Chloroflexota bacterium]